MKAGREKTEVKIILLGVLIVAVMLSSVSFISANFAMASIGGPKTLVNGEIYYAANGDPVIGATVSVECNHNNGVSKTKATSVLSKSDGTYFVIFNQKLECDEDDVVTVTATKDGITGTNTGVVHNGVVGSLDVAVVNVPMVPEFGTFVGVLTVLGAVGVFFVVRKKHNVRIKKK